MVTFVFVTWKLTQLSGFDGGSSNYIPPIRCRACGVKFPHLSTVFASKSVKLVCFLRAKVLMLKRELILVTRNGKTSVSLISLKSSQYRHTIAGVFGQ